MITHNTTCDSREFKDVVFEDEVLDNNRFDLILYLYVTQYGVT